MLLCAKFRQDFIRSGLFPYPRFVVGEDPRSRDDSLSDIEEVTMMDINIQVQDSLVIFEQLQNCKHNVVGVAETTRLTLLSMMESSTPIDGDIGIPA